MAYAQQPRYGAPQGPQHEHQQPFYASSHQAYAAEYDYEGGDQSAGFSGPPGRGPPSQYPDGYSQQGGAHGSDRGGWQGQGSSQHTNGGQYGGRGQKSGGMSSGPISQRGARGADRNAYGDPRSRGPSQPRSRPPPRGQNQQQDASHQASRYREPQAYEQQYAPEQDVYSGVPVHANDGYEYEDPSYGPQDDWHSNQRYGQSENRANGYQYPQHGFDHHSQEYHDGYDTRAPPGGHANAQTPPISKYDDASAPRSTKGQSQGSSTRSESSQSSKPKKIIETRISPESLAWDNPFPTFPMRPKKATHSKSQSLNGSVAEQSNNRPQTATSKESSYTFADVEEPIQAIGHPSYQHPRSFDQHPPSNGLAEQRQDVASRSRENGRSGGRVEQLKPPTVNGRHSEDNRARPFVPLGTTVASNYGRSRTMPTAISESVGDPTAQPRQADQSSWQEPGPVAGYYGPDDREFLPLSPAEPSQQKPHGQSRAHSDERRPYGYAAVQAQNSNSRQPPAPHDSLGELFDDYYGGTQQDQQSHLPKQGKPHRSPVDEDMPNFDATVDPGSAHRRGMTIDEHLQPQQKAQAYPPMPAPPQGDGRRDHRNGPNPNGEYPPRSRSQPNLKDRRSPRAQQDDGFDFGVQVVSDRPPATAWSANRAGPNSPTGYPNGNPQQRDWPPPDRQYQGPTSPAGYAANDRNKANYPPPRAGPSPGAYQGNGPPDRYCSPHLQGRRPPPGQMRPPGGGPSPVDRNMANGAPPMGFCGGAPTDRYRSPPIPQGRSPQGQTEPPGGRPSPNYPTGPTAPPNKALSNPDALPSHPAPFRPGLNGSGPSSQAPKPAPVRNYNATSSPMQMSNPAQNSESSTFADKKRESAPITHQELDRFKQDAARQPDSRSAQLTLAKKLAEAASVLVDERTDSRTRSKIREKYLLDAHRIVKRLSSNGYPEATFYLADAYSRGSLGLESDTREAFKLYQTSAKQNNAQAAYRVAVCCEIGQEEGGGTSRDPVKAMQWYKRAATLGDTPAMYKMGIISLKGLLGQPKNPREALVWLKRAAERADRENPHALHEMVSSAVGHLCTGEEWH